MFRAGKYELEQQHREAMEQMENRIAQIEQDNSKRIHSLEYEARHFILADYRHLLYRGGDL